MLYPAELRARGNATLYQPSVLQNRGDGLPRQLGPAAELDQLDQHRDPGDAAATLLHEIDRRLGRAAGREQVVDDEPPLPGGNRVVVHLEAVAAVFEVVGRADG